MELTDFLPTRPLDAKGWREARDPALLLAHLKEQFVGGRAVGPLLFQVNPGRRKARRFAAACCRRVEHLLRFPQLSALLAMVEAYAEGQVGMRELIDAERRTRTEVGTEVADPWHLHDYLAREAHRLAPEYLPQWATPADRLAHRACLQAAHKNVADAVDCWEPAAEAAANAGGNLTAELTYQADLLRDLFGNPFAPVAFAPAWRTSAVLELARSACEADDYSVLPILADALQEAGCEDPDVLAHCRTAPVHARGCWVVEAALGR